ncbi:MAG: hydroxymethylpyrimidine/phosphomethylpyrimidine kinase [Bifidobacteriaceae bacterium]|jgi:pyridoxine kinase|nr:hydroxymethylpyrimidine/phosphomethylpyrimidine kinase [Bifidobacteriaceae bacterium]
MRFAYVIAGSEATGGAGLQADLKTFQRLGVYGIGTITCIVSFDPANDWGHRFHPVDPSVIAEQFEAANASQDLDTVKIGMLGTPATIDVVAEALASKPWRHVVLDPVLICKGQEPGAALNTDNALKARILPLATVVTPNNFEARALSGLDSLSTIADLAEAGRRILAFGPQAVIVKGGVDFPGPDAVDVLVQRDPAGGEPSVEVFSVPKIGQERVSGAGCTFASAVTAELAKGATVAAAVGTAKALVTRGIEQRVSGHTPFDTVWQGA